MEKGFSEKFGSKMRVLLNSFKLSLMSSTNTYKNIHLFQLFCVTSYCICSTKCTSPSKCTPSTVQLANAWSCKGMYPVFKTWLEKDERTITMSFWSTSVDTFEMWTFIPIHTLTSLKHVCLYVTCYSKKYLKSVPTCVWFTNITN